MSFLDKITSRQDAAARVKALPQPVVFTNGVFDVLHTGHVTYLAQARALVGEAGSLEGSLVVALNTDASAKRLGKGKNDVERPLNNETDRATLIAALESVSLVTWFDEDTPLEIINDLRPDVIVKGGDYDMAKLKEAQLVESYGGKALALPFVEGYSTTALVAKIRSNSLGVP